MISYFDTSLLVKLYIEERDSDLARRMAARRDLEVVISWLSEVEVSAALHARPLRSAPSPLRLKLDKAYKTFLHEMAGGMYRVVSVDRGVFELARSLGERYGALLGVRALDMLHVAAAVRGGAEHLGRSMSGRDGWRKR